MIELLDEQGDRRVAVIVHFHVQTRREIHFVIPVGVSETIEHVREFGRGVLVGRPLRHLDVRSVEGTRFQDVGY